jgi:oxalate decarboxylase/phosphoglucose isomerase-like protein (cupin superfamily)
MGTSSTSDAHTIGNEPSGEWLQSRPGERFSIRVPATATNGCYSVTEIISNPGDSTPVHLHEREDEHILVVEGTARVLYGDKTFDATAGTVVSLAGASRTLGEIPPILRFGWSLPPRRAALRRFCD